MLDLSIVTPEVGKRTGSFINSLVTGSRNSSGAYTRIAIGQWLQVHCTDAVGSALHSITSDRGHFIKINDTTYV